VSWNVSIQCNTYYGVIILDSVIYNCGRMGIEDHFLQEFQDIYQFKTFQYNQIASGKTS
jgi:hypothetical protein